MSKCNKLIFENLPYQCVSLLRNIATAIRVRAGRNSVQSGLAESLTVRNHILDDLFSSKVLKLKEKKKDDTDVDDDGYRLVDKVGVSSAIIFA